MTFLDDRFLLVSFPNVHFTEGHVGTRLDDCMQFAVQHVFYSLPDRTHQHLRTYMYMYVRMHTGAVYTPRYVGLVQARPNNGYLKKFTYLRTALRHVVDNVNVLHTTDLSWDVSVTQRMVLLHRCPWLGCANEA